MDSTRHGNLDEQKIRDYLEECVTSRWQDRWMNCEYGSTTYKYMPNVDFVQKIRNFILA